MLRRSLQNYAKVKAASSQSRGSSEYASCKENIPAISDCDSTDANRQTREATPMSRFDHIKAAALSSKAITPQSRSTPTVCFVPAHLEFTYQKIVWSGRDLTT